MRGGERVVHLVVPAWVDDPTEPSGGNTYDRRLARALADTGRVVHVHLTPDPALPHVLRSLDPGALVVLDGLLASGRADAVVPHRHRLRLVLLLHLPRGTAAPDSSEAEVVAACAAVVVPSEWCRRAVLAAYDAGAERVRVATPGVDPAEPPAVPGPPGELLVVAAVTRAKGHDVLLEAVGDLRDLRWRVRCVGPLTRDPAFVAGLRASITRAGLDDRFLLTGPLTGPALAAAYDGAGLLVLPSRGETYGMVVTEALARGLPVVASRVGGVPEALGTPRAGLLVPPEDPAALATALRRWLTDDRLRAGLRAGARHRRALLSDWPATARSFALALDAAPAAPAPGAGAVVA